MKNTTIGVIFGNRNFFPDYYLTEARRDIIAEFQDLKIKPVVLAENETKLGGVETYGDAQKCADLFKQQRNQIDGVLIVLPNFGDERAVVDTLKMAKLDVPV
jgi:L-fucose isomerase-like protein